MKYFIDPETQQIFAYEADGSQDAWIKPGLVSISDNEVAELRAAQIDPKDAIRLQIAQLESSVTPRRLREAVVTGDYSFIKSIDDKVAALRAAL